MDIHTEFKRIEELSDLKDFITKKISDKHLQIGVLGGRHIHVSGYSGNVYVKDLLHKLEMLTKRNLENLPKNSDVYKTLTDSKAILTRIVEIDKRVSSKDRASSIVVQFFTRISPWLGNLNEKTPSDHLIDFNSVLSSSSRMKVDGAKQRAKVKKEAPRSDEQLKTSKRDSKKPGTSKEPLKRKKAPPKKLEVPKSSKASEKKAGEQPRKDQKKAKKG